MISNPKISVIIPTYNRADSVKETLRCLKRQQTGRECDYEVIVVDNNSADRTKEAVRSCFWMLGGKLKYLFEPRQGKSFALNRGIQNAKGSIIACLDDDCVLEDGYVLSVHEAFKKAGPEIGFIGGRIWPRWAGAEIPAWFHEFLPGDPGRNENSDGTNEFFCGPLGILDYGNEPFVVEPNPKGMYPKLFYGANLSFRKSVFERFGYFTGERLLLEDTEMCLRLLNSGVKALYAPDIKVFHKIDTGKVAPEYYYNWYFNKGLRREIVQTIDTAFCDETWAMFHRSYGKSTKDMMLNRCQALFNFGQMIKSWTPYDGGNA